MAEMFEEWKPFPKDKVNRQIEKREKKGDSYDKKQAHVMKAVKNYKTKATDFRKADQKLVGSDREDYQNKYDKHRDELDKSKDKMNKNLKKENKANEKGLDKKKNKKKYDKAYDKVEKHRDEANKHAGRAHAMSAVRKSSDRALRSEDEKQAEINKKDKADRSTAKRMMNRAGLEKAYKDSPSKPTSKSESMDFTEFLKATIAPLYEKEGAIPKCPPGYRFDKEMMMCVPKTKKDAVGSNQKEGGNKDLRPGNGAGYNTWGTSGYDGAGYAWEEPPTTNDKSSGSFE
jgi:hypothetical protein